MILFFILHLLISFPGFGATIAIIDTGFDLDHDYLKPKLITSDSEEESLSYQGWNFFDNAHLKKAVIEDKSAFEEILLFRNLRAKGHTQGLTLEEFEWFNKKNADKEFMEKVRLFKKHAHGTFVAGIALREGENINILPIRGINPPTPVVAIKDESISPINPPKGKTPEEKFQDEINQSIKRISSKFSKICRYISLKKIEIVNASYGITYKNILTKFRDRYREMTGSPIDEAKLKILVDDYFESLYQRGMKTIKKYPQTLFIFSAGNSGLDNDLFHHYPSRIKLDNTITVAATNGDFLATFSNYGLKNVDIGAPGVGILSLVPKVYSDGQGNLYSPSSGTSMAAPYVSNLAAQIKNIHPLLSAAQIKRIILETGQVKEHLRSKISSGAIVDNQNALRAALLSKDFNLDQAVSLGVSGLIPIEDKISLGQPPKTSPTQLQEKIMQSLPQPIPTTEVEELPELENTTKSESSLQKDTEKVQQDNSGPLPSKALDAPKESSDPTLSNQSAEQSPPPSEVKPPSSSESAPPLPEAQSPENAPSSPQS